MGISRSGGERSGNDATERGERVEVHDQHDQEGREGEILQECNDDCAFSEDVEGTES